MQYCDVITHPRWRTAAILKIVNSPYLSEKSSDFDQVWYTTADIEPNDSHVTKNWIFQNSRWRRPATILKIAFLAITHRPIVWFQRNFLRGSRTACRQGLDKKTAIFKNPRWRTAAILKIVKLPYLSEKSSDFDEIWYTTSDIEPGCSHVTKKEFF